MLTVNFDAARSALLQPPPSKSDALRAFVLSYILGRPLPEDDPAWPDDMRRMRSGLLGLGGTVDCGDGAAPLRLLVALAAIRPDTTRFTGSERLSQRDHRVLVAALRNALGCTISDGWPMEVTGSDHRVEAATFRVDGGASSQPVSALWLAAAALCVREQRPRTVESTGPITSAGYVALTLRWLIAAGFDIQANRVVAWAPRELPAVPRDWSAVAALTPIAWATRNAIQVDASALHPDRLILEVLSDAGFSVGLEPSDLRITGTASRGFSLSAKDAPDLVPTLAAWATALPYDSVFSNLAVLRGKESDRFDAVLELVATSGGTATGDQSRLVIRGAAPPGPMALALRGDHRLAFAATALAALHRVQVSVTDEHCVAKSFPGWWDEVGRAGATVSRTPTSIGRP